MQALLMLEKPDGTPIPAKATNTGELKVDVSIAEATIAIDSTGLASGAKQDTAQTALDAIKTDVDKIPSKGTASMTGSTPVTLATDDVASLALKPVGSMTNGSKALSTSAAALAGSASPAKHGVWVSNPLANTVAVYVGASGVTAATGIELQPGDREFFRIGDAAVLYAVAASGTPTIAYVVE